MGCHTCAGAGKAQSLLGGGLYADLRYIHPAGIGNIAPHFIYIRRQLWTLRQKRSVNVLNLIAMVGQYPHHFFQQFQAVRPLPAVICIRKQVANVTQRRRAQQGVRDGVKQHIRIAVPQQTLFKRNGHTA